MTPGKSIGRTGLRVLLAEPQLPIRENVRVFLERAGHEVVAEARDGLEASRLAGAHLPDLAVLDLSLPVLGGLAAGSLIRGLSPRTHLIAIGGHEDGALMTAALEAGFVGFVVRERAAAQLARAIHVVRDGTLFIGGITDLGGGGAEGVRLEAADPAPRRRGARRDTKTRRNVPPTR